MLIFAEVKTTKKYFIMKQFKDLVFKNHPVPSHFDKQATIKFDNGYGISVINGTSAYCGKGTFEVAVIFNDEITYNTEITDDVLTYQTPEDIDNVMIKIQNLK